jgi:hypothetical protein
MRTFRDDSGALWDVVAGRESWGALYAIFVPRDGGGRTIRQAPLQASGYDEAARELTDLDDGALQRLLDSSEAKQP